MYFSVEIRPGRHQALTRVGAAERLVSYARFDDFSGHESTASNLRYLRHIARTGHCRPEDGSPMKNRVNLMLDSGAFSAWKKGRPIDLRRYIRFIEKHRECFATIVNLDVIPGEPGIVPSPQRIKEAARQGWANFQTLRKAGIESLPIYHQGEKVYWLDKILDSGADYIGVASNKSLSGKQRMAFLDQAWRHITERGGYPTVKVHGFGETSPKTAFRYPWYSLDSVSWLLAPSYGSIMVAKPDGKGGYDYRRPPTLFAIAKPRPLTKAESRSMGQEGWVTRGSAAPSEKALRADEHWETCGEAHREAVRRYAKHLGFTIDQLRDGCDEYEGYVYRCALGARFFQEQMKAASPPPRFAHEGTLSDLLREREEEGRHGSKKVPPWRHPKMFFTIPLANPHSVGLTSVGAWDRLITYWYYVDGSRRAKELFHLARTGTMHGKGKPLAVQGAKQRILIKESA